MSENDNYLTTKQITSRYGIQREYWYKLLNKYTVKLTASMDQATINNHINSNKRNVKNGNGKLWHINFVKAVITRKQRRKTPRDFRTFIKEIENTNWEIIGNIHIEKLTIDDVEKLMVGNINRFRQKQRYIKANSIIGIINRVLKDSKKEIEVFYVIEQNPSNEYYHAHFLIKGTNTKLTGDSKIRKLNSALYELTQKKGACHVEICDEKMIDKTTGRNKGVQYNNKMIQAAQEGMIKLYTIPDERSRSDLYNKVIVYKPSRRGKN